MTAAQTAICMRCPHRALCRLPRDPTAHCEHWPAPLPGLPTLAVRAAKEVGQWIASGAPKADPELIAQRRAICQECPHWDAAAFAGTGRCMHNKCGCTSAKHHMPTSKCPMSQW
jgi:hypothetical protein